MKLKRIQLLVLVLVFLSLMGSKCTKVSDGTFYVEVRKAEIFTTVNRFDANQLNAVFTVGGKNYVYALDKNKVEGGCYHLTPLAVDNVNVPWGVDGVARWYGNRCP